MPTTARRQNMADRLAAWAEEFDRHLDQMLTPGSSVSPRLDEAIRYSALLPGKRVRPYLVAQTGLLFGVSSDQTRPASVAIECIHAFSLIHDDLPAMDDDDLRRGRPANHKVFGEAIAILAGDALVTLAFEVLATQARSPHVAAGWVAELADATGRQGMIGGQAVDILGESQPPTAQQVARIHASKTSRLFQSACRLGAIAAAVGPDDYRSISDYGMHLGLAFQMADDLLDVTSQTEIMGKNTAKDSACGKQTYPRVVGMERAHTLATQEVDLALAALESFDNRADRLRDLARFVIERNR